MLVGVLISIMISMVVGVSLVPSIISAINAANTQITAIGGFSGLTGLTNVLAYVLTKTSTFRKEFLKQTDQIRGSLKDLYSQGNPELNLGMNQ